MKKLITIGSALLLSAPAIAENVEDADRIICASGQAQICLETGDCYDVPPFELNMPDFVLIDVKKKTLSSTEASKENRSTKVKLVESADGVMMIQGIENSRTFSLIIHEATGRLTAAISRDGLTVTVFGACTDADL